MGKLRARLLKPVEKAKYQLEMERYHYLGASKTNLSAALQYVVEDESGQWLALLDIGHASLKNSSRDKWIGWSVEQQESRRRSVVCNTRFLVLPWGRGIKNLASQCLSLVTKRLRSDWVHYHGYHIYLVETYIDTSRFSGACYKASNWVQVGETKGYSRKKEGFVEHGNKKAIYLYPLHRKAKQILSTIGFPNPYIDKLTTGITTMIDVNRLPIDGKGGLLEALTVIPDSRAAKGKKYKHSSILAQTVCAVLSGADSFQAITDYGKNLSHEARAKLGFRIWNMPSEKVIRTVLNSIDAKHFDSIVSQWTQQHTGKLRGKAIAVDGKVMRASRTCDDKQPHLLSAILHHDGLVLAQHQIPDKTNEIPEVKNLLEPLELKGSIVTLDALHTQKKTAQFITQGKHADYLMTVKENQADLLDKIQRLPEEAFSPCANNCRKRTRQS